jgi:beta-lactamase superfamily II metal-dependent hydrolase
MKRRSVLKIGKALALGGLLWPLAGCRGTDTEAESTGSASAGETTDANFEGVTQEVLPQDVLLELHAFAAGKADALLLTTANSAVLVDCGEKGFGKTIAAYLAAQGIEALDALILTHFDKDHVGGAAKVLKTIPTRRVLCSNCPKDSDEYANYCEALAAAGLEAETVRTAQAFELDGVRYTIDPPAQEAYADDASNNSSLVVAVQAGAVKLLLAGDAEQARIDELLSGFLAENPGPYDLVKLPHHGRWESNLPQLLEATGPRNALITCSDDMPEDDATAELLAREGIATWLTRTAPVQAATDGITLDVWYADPD